MLPDEMTDSKPGSCLSVGLDCSSCASRRAVDVAALCSNLGPSALESTFFRMYPDPACAPMVPQFAASYYQATAPAPLTLLRLASATAA